MSLAAVGSMVSDQEIVDELRAAWADVSRSYARVWAAMTEVARRTTIDRETAEIAAALTFTPRRADYELGCAQTLVEHLPRVHSALATGNLDHHQARVFTDYLTNVTVAQADRICARLVPLAPRWTTGQLAARLLREVQAIDPDYTRRTYQQAIRERGVHGYLDHTGTAVLTGSGLPAAEGAAAATRLEALADQLRAAGYPATVHQTRADLFLRLLDGTLDGLSTPQILATMLTLGPLHPADPGPAKQPTGQPDPGQPESGRSGHQPPQHQPPKPPAPPKLPAPAERPAPPAAPVPPAPAAEPAGGQPPCPDSPRETTTTTAGVRYGIEVRVRLSTLLGLDDHPAELPGWGPIPAPAARNLVAAQHAAEWRIAIVDTDGYLVHGDLTRRRPSTPGAHPDRAPRVAGVRVGGIVEIALPEMMLPQLSALADAHPEWSRVLAGISGSWTHRDQARAVLDQHPHRRFAHAALRRHVQMRDRHCIGIGCRRPAATAELDHTHDHAHGGQTVTTNSGPCCGRDHAMKHQGGWTLTQSQAGHFTWISPLGQLYHTRGEPLTPNLPAPLPRDPDPYPDVLPMMFEGPILDLHEPPPAEPSPSTRPPPPELPDDPPF